MATFKSLVEEIEAFFCKFSSWHHSLSLQVSFFLSPGIVLSVSMFTSITYDMFQYFSVAFYPLKFIIDKLMPNQ